MSSLPNIDSKYPFSLEKDHVFNNFNWSWVRVTASLNISGSVDSEQSSTAAGASAVHTSYWDQTIQQVRLRNLRQFNMCCISTSALTYIIIYVRVFLCGGRLQRDYWPQVRTRHFYLLVCVIFSLLKLLKVTVMTLRLHISEMIMLS